MATADDDLPDEAVSWLTTLALSAAEREQARAAVLEILLTPGVSAPATLVEALLKLYPTDEDKRQGRGALNVLPNPSRRLRADRFLQLNPTAVEKEHARGQLLDLLCNKQHSWASRMLVQDLILLDPLLEEKRAARQALLKLVPDSATSAGGLVDALLDLNPTTEEKRQACVSILRLLAVEADGGR